MDRQRRSGWRLTALGLLLSSSASYAAPGVLSVSPPRQTISADAIAHIVIRFDTPLDPSTVTSSSFRVFGRWSGPASGSFLTDDGNTRVRFIPDDRFFSGEWVTVSLSSAITDSGGDPLATGYTWNFWVRSTIGTLDQTQIAVVPIRYPGENHIQSYGAYAGDLNADGWSDLSIPNEITNDVRVMLNDGAGMYGTFDVYPLPGGSIPSTNEGGDFDGDGDIDLAVGNGGNDRMHVLMGTGVGSYQPAVSYTSGSSVRGIGVLDLDADGHDDIVTANRLGDHLSLFINLGNGAFAPAVAMEANGSGETAIAVADANGDGIQDVFVGTFGGQEIILLLGDGNGGLTYSTEVSAGGRVWMLAAGDVNGDGHVDVVSANSFAHTASVVLGDGLGGLGAATTYGSGLFPLAIDLGDLDGDGDLDMVTSNYSSANWVVYENAGDGTFSIRTILLASTAGSCAILHDRDNDGDLDISAIDEIDDLLFIFDNDPSPVGIGDAPVVRGVELYPNHPNPFNPSTTIRYRLPEGAHVRLEVFDARGRQVATLENAQKPAGVHASAWNAPSNASGLYFVRLEAGSVSRTRKIVLLK